MVHVPRRFVREEWGGTETVVLETCKRLASLGHGARIMSSRALSRQDRETMEGIEVRRFPHFYPYFGLDDQARAALDRKGGNLFSFGLLRELNREPALDLIHLHTLNRLGGICRHVARRRKIPYVVSLHGGVFDVPVEESRTWTEATRSSFEWGKVLGWWFGSRHVLRDAAAVICVGQKEAHHVREHHPHQRVVYQPNGVDVHRFRSGDGARFREAHRIGAQDPMLLCVGRISRQKNQGALVEAMPRLVAERPGVRLVLIGHVTEDTYRNRLRAMIREARLDERVIVIEGLSSDSQELVDAYHAADLFVLPSIHEPFGIVILEAWAAGRAVLASRVGGIPGFVEDGVEAVLFEPSDTGELAARIGELLDQPVRRAALGSAGRRKAEEYFDWGAITDRLLRLYEEVLVESPLRQ